MLSSFYIRSDCDDDSDDDDDDDRTRMIWQNKI